MFHVSDVEEACDWYSRLLLAEPVYLLEDFPVLRVGNAEICFHKADSKVSSGKAGVVTYWRVADFKQAAGRAEGMGGTIHRGPLAIEDGNTICQIADPFGNLFGLIGPVTVKEA
ncbi:MAG: VOC family protein [Bdellovibrionota bacterium]